MIFNPDLSKPAQELIFSRKLQKPENCNGSVCNPDAFRYPFAC